MDEEVWNEFSQDWDELTYESELLFLQPNNEISAELINLPEGKMRETLVKTRINQQFFRSAVLTAYENTCCITGLPLRDLLVASHIVPWKIDVKNRTNPRNGLCLNALHDKAFDLGFLTITSNLTVLLSPDLEKRSALPGVREFFINYKNAPLRIPSRFAPDPVFLEYHNDMIFRSHS
jgi:putative restriction endonuclease